MPLLVTTEAGLCMTVKNTVNTANEIHVLAYPYEGHRTQIDVFFRISYVMAQ